jgi:protein-disulfide isomerase
MNNLISRAAGIALPIFLLFILLCSSPWSVSTLLAQQDTPERGSNTAPVTIVEYADYQCPFCGQVAPVLQELMRLYPNEVKLKFKHFPLPFHSDAALAHQAALAAGEQGRFWEMHDLLFKNQKALKHENLVSYAVQLGLDKKKFLGAIDAMKFRSVVEKDFEEGLRQGVNATPTFFIDGKKFQGAQPLWAFQSAVEEKLARLGIKTKARILADASSRGKEGSPVVLTIFADFQSSISAETARNLEQIRSVYPEQVRIVFKNFPLPSHLDASLAHEAAMAAANQWKFWEMHDLLFQDQGNFSEAKLLENGREIGLDLIKFSQDLKDHTYRPIVSWDLEEGKSRNVRGVPTIFINDKRVDGLQPLPVLKSFVEEELTRKTNLAGKVVSKATPQIGSQRTDR